MTSARARTGAPELEVTTRRPLRVAHVVQNLEVGGLEKQVLELARRTDRRIVLPEVVCVEEIGALAELYPLERPAFALGAHPGFDWRVALRLVQYFRDSAIDIVHSHNERAHYLSALASRVAGVPVHINTRHGMHPQTSWRGTLRLRAMAMLSDTVVAVSSAACLEASQRDRIPAAKLRMIYNGTDVAAARLTRSEARRRLSLKENDFVVGAIGRLAPEKDHASFIEAFARSRTEVPHLTAVVLGDGPLAKDLVEAARARGLDGMRFHGYRADAVSLLPAFDLFLQPSLSEGISLALIEAMAAELPVIATSVGGNPEAIGNGEAGILVAARDVVALADAIVLLARDAARRTALADAARRRADRYFSIEATARAYEALYLERARSRGVLV